MNIMWYAETQYMRNICAQQKQKMITLKILFFSQHLLFTRYMRDIIAINIQKITLIRMTNNNGITV